MTKRLCIFGEVLFDCFPDGQEVLGGAPFNVAWHLQAFGLSPLFISRVGDDDAGRRVREVMSEWGMTQDGLQLDPVRPTGRVAITLKDGEPSYDIVANSAFDAIAPDALPPVEPALIYHGSLAFRNPISKSGLYSLETLKSRSPALIFVDVNLRTPWWNQNGVLKLLEGADWVKLNREELRLLHGDRGEPYLTAVRFRDALGLTGLVLTLGADGAIAIVADQAPIDVVPAKVSEVVDAVGAGDAFASVLLLGLQFGWPIEATLQRAQRFASELVKRRGATITDRSFYRSFANDWALKA